MSYSRVWDETAPDGTAVLANTLDSIVRNLKIDIRERMVSIGVTNWATDASDAFAQLIFEGTNPNIFGGTVGTHFRSIDNTRDILTLLDVGDVSNNRDFTIGRDLNVTRNVAITGTSLHTGASTFTGPVILNGNTKQTLGQLGYLYHDAGNSGAALVVDWNAGNSQLVTLNAAGPSITFANPIAGSVYRLRLKQDATGGRFVTLPANFLFLSTTGALTRAASTSALYVVHYDGANYFGVVSGDYAI